MPAAASTASVIPTADMMSVKDFGAKGDGAADDTAALKRAFEAGGRMFVPSGTYLIDTPQSGGGGGVKAILASSLEVVCDPRAKFIANSERFLDATMISFHAAPSATGLRVMWRGCMVDLTHTKNSTVTPYSGNFPPTYPGKSSVTDGVDFRGAYLRNGHYVAGFAEVSIDGSWFAAGTHWQTAGGDSALFVEGAERVAVTNNNFQASLDAALYLSRDNAGESKAGNAIISGNRFLNCQIGVALKRSFLRAILTGNTFQNTTVAIVFTSAGQASGDEAVISNNIIEGAAAGVRLDDTDNVAVVGNLFYNGGARNQNGEAFTAIYASPAAILLNGATRTFISSNRVYGTNPQYRNYGLDGVYFASGKFNGAPAKNVIVGNYFGNIGCAVHEEFSGAGADRTYSGNVVQNSECRNLPEINHPIDDKASEEVK